MSKDHEQLGLDRIAFFSDGVMAIAITLLVLDLKLPHDVHGDLLPQLDIIYGKILSYLISFMAIIRIWISHHRMFTYLRRYDRGFIGLNSLLLLFVAFLPFPTSILDIRNPDSQVAVFYALNFSAIGLVRCVIWYYASHNRRLISDEVSVATVRAELWIESSVWLVNLITIPVAIFKVSIVGWCWLGIWVFAISLNGRKWGRS